MLEHVQHNRGEDAFQKPMTYVIMLCMFATIFMQLHWLAVALTWFDAVYCIPVFQVKPPCARRLSSPLPPTSSSSS